MDNATIISYPETRSNALLSLTHNRSKYMLPFAGKFRVADFTIANALRCGALKTILYSNCEDDLAPYVEKYGPFQGIENPAIRVVSQDFFDINALYSMVLDANTPYYVLYNGDNPSIIDFNGLFEEYIRQKRDSVIFKMRFGERASMAHVILATNQKALLSVINHAIKARRESPNVFEMIINGLLNREIDAASFDVQYWPIKNIPYYYYITSQILMDPELFSVLYKRQLIKTKIETNGISRLGPWANISNSFISDGCEIHGTVINSIIYPGVIIGERAVVRDSIVLPYARLGAGAQVVRSIIDEKILHGPETQDIAINARIGSSEELMKNNDFPRSIFNSITLIGKEAVIPEGVSVGGACYIAPGKGGEYFLQRRRLEDGLSIL